MPSGKAATNAAARVGVSPGKPATTASAPGLPGAKPPNAPAIPGRPGVRGPTNLSQGGPVPSPRLGARTNLSSLAAGRLPGKAGGATNAVPASALTGSKTVNDLLGRFRVWQTSSSFYPILFATAFGLLLLGLLLARLIKSKRVAPEGAVATSSVSSQFARRKASGTVNSCNVVQVGEFGRQLWNFAARGRAFTLNREQTTQGGDPLPASLVARDWRTLFQRKLNIAWLPPEHIFLRVVQLPLSDFNETVAMVELQLEKLSPIPITQIAWSLQILPNPQDHQQTVIVIIAARNVVEEFLGQLEGQGFLADRLDVPALDQLQATPIKEDGAWIYPSLVGGKYAALAAWWYGGVLRNLDLLNLPATQRAAGLKEQAMQMAWAGELEGWLTSNPRWHLVADPVTAADWEPALREGLAEPVEVITPVAATQLAALTATRATHLELQANLMPPEFSKRYQQQFVDRLWMGGVGLVLGLYLVGVAIYGVAVAYLTVQTRGVQTQVTELGSEHTNAMHLKARYEVLATRQDLKFASLDCWRVVAELLPTDATLDSYNFSDGRRLTLTGTAPTDQAQQLLEFEKAMRKATVDHQLLFDPTKGETLSQQARGPNLQWSVSFELKRVEVQ